jgi:hypothetical protein
VSGVEFDVELVVVVVVVVVVVEVALEPWEVVTAVTVPPPLPAPLNTRHFDCNLPYSVPVPCL